VRTVKRLSGQPKTLFAMKPKVFEVMAMTWKFYKKYARSREMDLGFLAALIAFALRAVASGSLIPLALTSLVNSLEGSGSAASAGEGVTRALFMIAAAAVIFATTEWLFRPFWNAVAKSIVKVKEELIAELDGRTSRGRVGDMVGRVANDVDFVMWNVGGMYTTFTPNLLTAAVSLMTIFELSPMLAVIALALAPLSLVIMEPYIGGVEGARKIERSSYSEVMHLIDEYFKGNADSEQIKEALNRWYGGMTKQVFYDRTFWSSSLAYSYLVPLLLAVFGIRATQAGRLPVGNLVGVVYASMNVYSPLVGAISGLTLLGQNVAPMRRIIELSAEKENEKVILRA